MHASFVSSLYRAIKNGKGNEMNDPNEPHVTDSQAAWEIGLIQKHYDKSGCRESCPMYSEVRDVCMVLADDMDWDACPDYWELIEENSRKMQEEHEAQNAR